MPWEQWPDWTALSGQLANLLWNNPVTLLALLGTGIYLSVRLGFIQIWGFRAGLRLLRRREQATGDISGWQALNTTLSATVGTGNIAGVATAISLGGPGALFWMWLTAFAGMATKLAECTLALHFRRVDATGAVAGGPMYVLADGLGMRRAAAAFALFAMIASLGIGNMVQANSIIDALRELRPAGSVPNWPLALALTVGVGLTIIGGVRRIAAIATALVPFMCLLYLGAGLTVVLRHLDQVPAVLWTVRQHALNPQAAGAAAIGEAIRWGVARGLFSNEAGLGSSMAMAAARFRQPFHGGLVAMLTPFIDTLVICSITGFVILISGSLDGQDTERIGAALTARAFTLEFGAVGGWIVAVGLTLFAFSTIIAWSYYGDRCALYLFGQRAVLPYRLLFVALVFVGSLVSLKLVWNIADITNLLMALPNLIAVILLAGLVKKLRDQYFADPQT